MKRFVVCVCVLIVNAFVLFADETVENVVLGASESKPALVLLVNLWGDPVDVQLGDKPIFSIEKLAPGTPTGLISIVTNEPQHLFYKPHADSAWRYWAGTDNTQGQVRFEPGTLSVLRIGLDGTISIIVLALDMGNGPHIAFLNATHRSVDEISLVPDTLLPVARASDVPSEALTSFVLVEPGNYGGRWSSQGVSSLTTGTEPGTLGVIDMKPDGWYFFIAYGTDGLQPDAGRIWNVSPVQALIE